MIIAPPLSPAQQQTLRAAVNRLIPPDEQDGGGVAAHAHEYIEVQLTGDLASLQETYRTFLDALDTGTARFMDLSPDEQDARLVEVEASKEWGVFFRRFVEHAQEGFYISPVSWKMVGWEVRG